MFISCEGILFTHFIQEKLILRCIKSVILSFPSLQIILPGLLFWPCNAFLGHAFCRAGELYSPMWITSRKIAAICKSLSLMRALKTLFMCQILLSKTSSPIPGPHSTHEVKYRPHLQRTAAWESVLPLYSFMSSGTIVWPLTFCAEKSGKGLL